MDWIWKASHAEFYPGAMHDAAAIGFAAELIAALRARKFAEFAEFAEFTPGQHARRPDTRERHGHGTPDDRLERRGR